MQIKYRREEYMNNVLQVSASARSLEMKINRKYINDQYTTYNYTFIEKK